MSFVCYICYLSVRKFKTCLTSSSYPKCLHLLASSLLLQKKLSLFRSVQQEKLRQRAVWNDCRCDASWMLSIFAGYLVYNNFTSHFRIFRTKNSRPTKRSCWTRRGSWRHSTLGGLSAMHPPTSPTSGCWSSASFLRRARTTKRGWLGLGFWRRSSNGRGRCHR